VSEETHVYSLYGGPLDGEKVALEIEALRIIVPYACDNGCCSWGETYDWDEKSDSKRHLYYVGAIETEDYDGDDDVQYVFGLAEFLTDHHAQQEEIAELEAMFFSDGYDDPEGFYDYD
jgi:hypothetical protein